MAKILVACEVFGRVRDALIARGHDAMSCDLLPTEAPGPHYQGDVMDILGDGWDGMIAHPPCTYLCNSGVRHLHSIPSRRGQIAPVHGEERWAAMREAALFFKALLDAPISRVAVENPIMHSYGRFIIRRDQSQIIQPWQFGHGEQKATCLWLRNLPLLVPTNIVAGREQRLHRLGPSADRWKLRSATYAGIAAAMAEQWGPIFDTPLADWERLERPKPTHVRYDPRLAKLRQ